MTSSTAIVQLNADPMMRGRVLALQAMVFMGSTPIGGPIVGALCEWFGARAGVAVGAAAALVAAAWGWHAAGLHRRHTTNANGGRPLLQPPTVDVLGDV